MTEPFTKPIDRFDVAYRIATADDNERVILLPSPFTNQAFNSNCA
jgi:hypothetical protein